MSELRVLVVEQDADRCAKLRERLAHRGIVVACAATAEEALASADASEPDAVLSEVVLPGSDGVWLLERIHERDPQLPVLLMASAPNISSAVRAMRLGAADCLVQSAAASASFDAIMRTLRRRALEDESPKGRRLRERLGMGLGALIGSSPAMRHIYCEVKRLASSGANVLIGGETGTGKGELAYAIHEQSGRSGAFVPVHCVALAPSLLESELFGHEKGAFTGANRRRPGRFELARGGTLFLDEVGDIPGCVQVKLLHVLQHKSFTRVGGEEAVEVDFRLVTATHRNLHQEIAAKRFREDLYYRLDVVHLELPPLRERGEDIAMLACCLLRRHASTSSKTITGFSPSALARLHAHDWPGNVRELDNVIERAVVLCPGGRVALEHIDLDLDHGLFGESSPTIPGSSMDEIKRHAILETLRFEEGSVRRAARVLGVSERTIQQRLRDWGLARPRGRPRKHRPRLPSRGDRM